jgi:hypothetical protein
MHFRGSSGLPETGYDTQKNGTVEWVFLGRCALQRMKFLT